MNAVQGRGASRTACGRYRLVPIFVLVLVLLSYATAYGQPTGTSDLLVDKRDSADPVHVGDEFVYTVSMTNQGPDTANNVDLTDELPPNVEFIRVTGTPSHINPAFCSTTDNTLRCNIGDIFPNTTINLEIHVRATAPGCAENTVTATPLFSSDPDPSSNTSSEVTDIGGTSCAPPAPPPPGSPKSQAPHQTSQQPTASPITQDTDQRAESGSLDLSYSVEN